MITQISALKISRYLIPPHGLIPNTSITNQPLLIYHQAFHSLPQDSSSAASKVELYLRSIGVVEPQWRHTMYPASHFHSTTHEVLVVFNGHANICFGHEDNKNNVLTNVEKGDVIIIPAGVAHRLMEDTSGCFEMVGSYPKGHNWDMCYGKPNEEAKIKSIKNISWFLQDPIYGDIGPAINAA